jgi:hypothetical protein
MVCYGQKNMFPFVKQGLFDETRLYLPPHTILSRDHSSFVGPRGCCGIHKLSWTIRKNTNSSHYQRFFSLYHRPVDDFSLEKYGNDSRILDKTISLQNPTKLSHGNSFSYAMCDCFGNGSIVDIWVLNRSISNIQIV